MDVLHEVYRVDELGGESVVQNNPPREKIMRRQIADLAVGQVREAHMKKNAAAVSSKPVTILNGSSASVPSSSYSSSFSLPPASLAPA